MLLTVGELGNSESQTKHLCLLYMCQQPVLQNLGREDNSNHLGKLQPGSLGNVSRGTQTGPGNSRGCACQGQCTVARAPSWETSHHGDETGFADVVHEVQARMGVGPEEI